MIDKAVWESAFVAAQAEAVTRNPDARSVRELSEQMGLGLSATKSRLHRMLKLGTARRVYKHMIDTTGRRQLIPAYELVTKDTP